MRWRSLPIVGGAYSDETKAWSVQDCVNYLPTPSEQQGTKSPSILRCVPGLVAFSDTAEIACRGLHVVQGSLYGVFGDNLYAIDSSGVATSKGSIGGVGRVQMAHNQIALGSQLVISASTGLTYVYNTVDDTLVHVTDEGFPGAIQLAFLDGYIIGVDPSRHFVFHSQIADALSYNSLDHFQAEALPDLIQGIAVTGGQLWVFGDKSIQPFRNRGSAGFVPSSAALLRVGCANGNTIAEVGGTLAWLADDGTVRIANGYEAQRISTRPLEQAISGNDWSQAFAFSWEDRGHAVYYLTMLDGQTWGYDLASGQWHRRQSYGLDKWRVNDLAFAYGNWFGGDYVSGLLCSLDWNAQHENGSVLERRRTMGYIADDGNRIIVNGFRLDVETGVSAPSVKSNYVLEITGDLPDGVVGDVVDYAYNIKSNWLPVACTIVSGSLPSGLTMDKSGKVSGSFNLVSTPSWRVQVKDSQGNVATLDDSAIVTAGDTIELSNITWRYLVTTKADTTDYSSPSFDDSSWDIGVGPFASFHNLASSYWNGPTSHGFPKSGTEVGQNVRVWMRAHVNLPSTPSSVAYEGWFDNGFELFANGSSIAAADHQYGEYGSGSVAAGLVAGDNLIVVDAYDNETSPSSSNWFYVGLRLNITY